jgi:hypothetical protein
MADQTSTFTVPLASEPNVPLDESSPEVCV